MATSYGVTAWGFIKKPLSQIQADIEDDLKSRFGAEIDLSPNEPFGQLAGIFAEREAALWDLAESVYDAAYPDSSEGIQLDNIAAITGTTRKVASRSTVDVVLIGTNGTVVPAGTVFSVANAGPRFVTEAAATIATLTVWASGTGYAVGDLRSNGGNVYRCITAGTSAGSGGPTSTSLDITDNTCHWRYLGAGAAAVLAACQSEELGPKAAAAGTLTVIETPVSGLTSVTNPLDAILGTNEETDAELRLRREREIRAIGSSPVEGLRADLLTMDPAGSGVAGQLSSGNSIVAAIVFENDTDATDGAGRPPHSFEAVVLTKTAPSSADDQEIADQIGKSKSAGIQAFGNDVTKTFTDSQGIGHTIKFSRVTEKQVWLIINVTKNVNASGGTDYPADGDDQVKQALVDFGSRLGVGDDVVDAALYAPIFAIAGVADVTKLWIGFSNPPTTNANLAIAANEIATFDSSRITVVAT